MPVTKSAIKTLRKDRKKAKNNNELRKRLSESLGKVRKSKSQDTLRLAVSIIDKAVQKKIIHKNKAARLKSKISKLVKNSILPRKAAKVKAKTKLQRMPQKKKNK